MNIRNVYMQGNMTLGYLIFGIIVGLMYLDLGYKDTDVTVGVNFLF